MDFLSFTTNHDMEYAINIADLIAIIRTPTITYVPGTHEAVVGMFKYHGILIPVIDTHILYYGTHRLAPLTLILPSKEFYSILIQKVNAIHRGKVPDEVRFIDPHDYEKSVLGFDKSAPRVELF